VGKASRRRKGSIHNGPGSQGRHERGSRLPEESSSRGSLQKTTPIITFIPMLIMLCVSFAVYFNALSGDFVYDDKEQVVDNPWIRDIKNIPTIFSKSVWSFQPGLSTSNYYRPLMHIVYMFNYHVFGLKPLGFHLVNILFHCGASVLVFLIIRRFLAESGGTTSSVYFSPPFAAAMLFASHPIHTEAVTWIAGLPDVAFTFFYLLSFYLYMLFRDGAKRGYLLSVLSFSVATLSKEPALTLPVMLVAYDYLTKKSDDTLFARIKRYLPYVAVSGIYLLVRYYALRSFAPIESYAELSTHQSIINVFPLFQEYLASLLWPFDLNFWHTFHPISSLFEAKGMISIVVTVIFVVVAVTAYRKNKVFFFSLLLLVIPLLPVFYIKGISGKPFAERYLYLPSVGFVLLPAVFLSWAREKLPRAAWSMTIVFIVILGLYTASTINRNNVWKDNFILWSDTVKKSPDSAIAHNNLGLEYKAKGQWDRAISEYQTALQLNPDYVEAHSNLGTAYEHQGLLDRAISEYRTALELNPAWAQVHHNLGLAYAHQGRWDAAIPEYQTALQLNPALAETHHALGIAYGFQGLSDRALAEYQAALQLKPYYSDAHMAHNALGIAYGSRGLLERAVSEFQAALQQKPDFIEARYNLASTYLRQGNADMARKELEVILEIRPDLNAARQLLDAITSSRH
jgi:tetratricopeptide (TPR) repeat protein